MDSVLLCAYNSQKYSYEKAENFPVFVEKPKEEMASKMLKESFPLF